MKRIGHRCKKISPLPTAVGRRPCGQGTAVSLGHGAWAAACGLRIAEFPHKVIACVRLRVLLRVRACVRACVRAWGRWVGGFPCNFQPLPAHVPSESFLPSPCLLPLNPSETLRGSTFRVILLKHFRVILTTHLFHFFNLKAAVRVQARRRGERTGCIQVAGFGVVRIAAAIFLSESCGRR